MEDLVNSTSKVNKWTYLGDEQWSELNDLNQVLAVTLNGESIDEIVSLSITPGIALDPVKDHLGSIHAWVNASTGAVVQKQKYSAYGETTVAQSSPVLASLGMLRGFTGRELDQDTKFQHNRARYYDPSTGRFLSEDPIGLDGGDVNLYRYVMNNPLVNVDPSGKFLQAVGWWLLKQIIKYPINKVFTDKPIMNEDDEVKKMYDEEKLRRDKDREGCGIYKSCEPEPQQCPGPA